MQFPLTCLLITLLASFALAATYRSVIISYPEGTEECVVEEAKDFIVAEGGTITVEFDIIPGFAANATEESLQQLRVQDADDGVIIEDDGIVTINDGGPQ